jgi:hypothetical protein
MASPPTSVWTQASIYAFVMFGFSCSIVGQIFPSKVAMKVSIQQCRALP